MRADSLTVLTLKASGPFRYRSQRVSGNSVWIDLENVNRGSLKRAGSLNGALIGYRVLEFEGESRNSFLPSPRHDEGSLRIFVEPQASGLKMTFGPDEVAPQPMGRTGATARTREPNSKENDVKAEPEPRVEKVSLRNETRKEEVSQTPLASALTPSRLYVVRLRESHQGDVLRIKIETSEPVRFKAFRLENPSRVVVDLRGVRSRVGRYRTFPFHSKLLERVRLAQFRDRDPAVVLVVADLVGSPRYRVTTVDGGILIELRGRAPQTDPSSIFASRRERKPKELAKASTSTSLRASAPTPSARREEVEASLPPSGSSPRVTAAVKPRPGPDLHALRAAKAARTLAGSLAPASAYQEPGGLTGLASSATKQEGKRRKRL